MSGVELLAGVYDWESAARRAEEIGAGPAWRISSAPACCGKRGIAEEKGTPPLPQRDPGGVPATPSKREPVPGLTLSGYRGRRRAFGEGRGFGGVHTSGRILRPPVSLFRASNAGRKPSPCPARRLPAAAFAASARVRGSCRWYHLPRPSLRPHPDLPPSWSCRHPAPSRGHSPRAGSRRVLARDGGAGLHSSTGAPPTCVLHQIALDPAVLPVGHAEPAGVEHRGSRYSAPSGSRSGPVRIGVEGRLARLAISILEGIVTHRNLVLLPPR